MHENLKIDSRIKLSDGHEMPRFGLGAYALYEDTYDCVLNSLRLGYRLIDTAQFYQNEVECGRAVRDFIKESGVKREEIFYTTKLWDNKTVEYTLEGVKTSLERSGLDYIDLFLLHGPVGGPEARLAAWIGCCEAKDKGLVRSIGVSNWGIDQLQLLMDKKPKYLPVVNQVELSPFLTRKELVVFDEKHHIVNEAWAPLVRGQKSDNKLIQSLGQKYNKSPAQVLIRYALQKNYVVIPRSSKYERLVENSSVFDFSFTKEEMKKLDQEDEHYCTSWDPSTLP